MALPRWVMHSTISMTRAARCVMPNRDVPPGLTDEKRKEAECGMASSADTKPLPSCSTPAVFNGPSGCTFPPPGQKQHRPQQFVFIRRQSAHAWSIDPVGQQVHLCCLHSGPLLYGRTDWVKVLSSLYLLFDGFIVWNKFPKSKVLKLLDEVDHRWIRLRICPTKPKKLN